MVYDRERKGPALVGIGLAEKLTRDQAEQLKQRLTALNTQQPTWREDNRRVSNGGQVNRIWH